MPVDEMQKELQIEILIIAVVGPFNVEEEFWDIFEHNSFSFTDVLYFVNVCSDYRNWLS